MHSVLLLCRTIPQRNTQMELIYLPLMWLLLFKSNFHVTFTLTFTHRLDLIFHEHIFEFTYEEKARNLMRNYAKYGFFKFASENWSSVL